MRESWQLLNNNVEKLCDRSLYFLQKDDMKAVSENLLLRCDVYDLMMLFIH